VSVLRQIHQHLWVLAGRPIKFFGFPYELRSTIIDLGDALFVHSPVQMGVAKPELRALGSVNHIVSPNKLHHLFLPDWASEFPEARLYAPPGLRARRPDIHFHADLCDRPEPEWGEHIDQRIVRGSFFMDEVVFFHRASRTLILGDLIENHDPRNLTRAQRLLASANAMLAPHGSTPRNYRLSFVKREAARRTLREVLSWEPERVIVAHGPCIEEGTAEFLHEAFAWLV